MCVCFNKLLYLNIKRNNYEKIYYASCFSNSSKCRL